MRTQLAEHHASAFAWALNCCGRRDGWHDAEDVLHDVYAAVLDNRLRFDGRSAFRTWLFGVIAQMARSRARRERFRALLRMTRGFRIDAPAAEPAADAQAIANDRHERTRRALDALPRRQREVLLLVFYHDLTIEEAARVMEVSLGTARVHYQRGKDRLATLLEPELEGEEIRT
ncbi:MAG TPA: RNA polymerase sigma factor [Gemmatimonadaceae bacterium]|nr:RNA polymerase sigma factor [Gemmatimonadaceae bacterium]